MSLASPPYTFLLYLAAREKKNRCIGCSTPEEYGMASVCSIGTAYLDPLPHNLALLVPSLLTLHCQLGLRIMELCCLLISIGFQNICKSSN